MIAMDRPEIASQLLTEVTEAKPFNDAAWYQLARQEGSSGDIIGVHQARAEYFLLNGDLERAEKQIVLCTTPCSSEFSVERADPQSPR